jgi:hypothetical protein
MPAEAKLSLRPILLRHQAVQLPEQVTLTNLPLRQTGQLAQRGLLLQRGLIRLLQIITGATVLQGHLLQVTEVIHQVDQVLHREVTRQVGHLLLPGVLVQVEAIHQVLLLVRLGLILLLLGQAAQAHEVALAAVAHPEETRVKI